MKFFVTKFFVETGKNAAHCKKCLKTEEICSALQISEKVSYICSAMHFLLANIRLEI